MHIGSNCFTFIQTVNVAWPGYQEYLREQGEAAGQTLSLAFLEQCREALAREDTTSLAREDTNSTPHNIPLTLRYQVHRVCTFCLGTNSAMCHGVTFALLYTKQLCFFLMFFFYVYHA